MTAEAEGLFGPPTLPPGVTKTVDRSVLDGPPRVFVRWDWPGDWRGGFAYAHRPTESAARAACRADYERATGADAPGDSMLDMSTDGEHSPRSPNGEPA